MGKRLDYVMLFEMVQLIIIVDGHLYRFFFLLLLTINFRTPVLRTDEFFFFFPKFPTTAEKTDGNFFFFFTFFHLRKPISKSYFVNTDFYFILFFETANKTKQEKMIGAGWARDSKQMLSWSDRMDCAYCHI